MNDYNSGKQIWVILHSMLQHDNSLMKFLYQQNKENQKSNCFLNPLVETAGRQAVGKQENPCRRSGMHSHSMLSCLFSDCQGHDHTFQSDIPDSHKDLRFHVEVLNKWLVSS